MLIDFKLLLFELNCQLFFFLPPLRLHERERVPYLIEARVGGRLRTGRVFAMEMLEKCQGCVLKCLVCFSGVDSCLLQSCFGGTGGKFKGHGASSGAEAPSLTWKFRGRADTLTPRRARWSMLG